MRFPYQKLSLSSTVHGNWSLIEINGHSQQEEVSIERCVVGSRHWHEEFPREFPGGREAFRKKTLKAKANLIMKSVHG